MLNKGCEQIVASTNDTHSPYTTKLPKDEFGIPVQIVKNDSEIID